MKESLRTSEWVLWAGDAAAYGLITLIGFSSHGALSSAPFPRILATFLPFYASWILFARWGAVIRSRPDRHWRWLLLSGISAFLSAPLAATLRAFWLDSLVIPTFVLVMAAVSSTGVMLWRLLYLRLIQPRLTG
ncbi:MAG: DUF3054 domain-containing protein [Anaerolineales bacterium]|nr:MAG: DUF3054 domain-containing protein [Anaerolineales bacterium]